jgi:N-acyl-D-amino-acid deacylase
MTHFDILIKNADVLDGTGGPARKADIGMRYGKIAAIAPELPAENSQTVIDAPGLTAAPGFIDVHTHDDLYLLRKPDAGEKILQGITSVVTGNCGFSAAPLVSNGRAILRGYDGILGGGEAVEMFEDVVTFEDYFDRLESIRPGVNVGCLVGNVTVRIAGMGHAMRPPEENEMAVMKSLIAEAMESGALGFSTGLIYAPGSYAQTPELIELASVAAGYGGIFTTHMRNEGEGLLDSIKETITIAETCGMRAQISHIKASGRRNWGMSQEAIRLIEDARERGIELNADQYPYDAGSTGLFALLPADVLAGGIDLLSTNLQDASYRRLLHERIHKGNLPDSILAAGDFARVLIAGSPAHPDYEGKTLQELSVQLGRDPLELVFDLVAEEKYNITVVTFGMDEADIRRFMQADFVMMGSDGLPSTGSRNHPRMCGTAPRILGRYVREQHVLKLEEAVRKMTSLPAAAFRLEGKGLLKEGFDADLVLFDPAVILDQATYTEPALPPVGIEYVLVNGVPAVEKGRVLGARSGKVLH